MQSEDLPPDFSRTECVRKDTYGCTMVFAKGSRVVEFPSATGPKSIFDPANRLATITRIGAQGIFILVDGEKEERVTSPNVLLVISELTYEELKHGL